MVSDVNLHPYSAARAAAAGVSPGELAEMCARAVEPAEERRVAGAAVPSALLQPLRAALEAARWPPVTHRRRVASERYLVVRREPQTGGGAGTDPYADLKAAAAAVMVWP